jgi:outer membrane lipoprotein-sorting protein
MKSYIIGRFAIVASAFLILSASVFALDKIEAYDYLKKTLKSVSSVSFSFEDINDKRINGTIVAAKGNKYKIVNPDRTITSDGKKIWNFSQSDNKVMISEFDNEKSGLSIESFFFEYMDKMELDKFEKEHSNNKTNGLFVMTLKGDDKFAKKNKIKYLKIWMDESKNIKFIANVYNSKTQTISISKLKLNLKLSAGAFTFKPPKGCKTIELD